MTLFKGFMNYFAKAFIIIFVIEFLSLFFFDRIIVQSLIVGTIISVFMALSWYSNYYKALHSQQRMTTTGTVTRVILVLLACIIWYKFQAELNIIAITVGLMSTYVIIFVNAVRHFRK
ncbi:ATP synthase subunit I [Nosocomiicoccus sp. HMSC09A07]|uniref:ATP synthase subunit I n=1 Tax=Nosocomiicoccus sp. HMSC09A07 TaxID=1581145 RepID=UPI0008A31170|nr:ATP synthase subunit I [Nosocomiicoccus sp. HMSC09A07]OFS63512.1 hypothetical protein HMPREF3177_02915 [Nosocomiicoccus sp. HMSC09A07]